MKNTVGVLLSATVLLAASPGLGQYAASWESLDRRPIPAWFDEAKFGIFIHWGVYAVPSWAPKDQYAEWYWHWIEQPDHPCRRFHETTYGPKFRYQDFAPMFKAELFDPAAWATLFKRAGARYVALTSKHHEGFCLWPSPDSWNWNSVDIGPHRDLCGELAEAVRAAGLKMGFYYSLYEWYNPVYRSDVDRYVAEHMLPQLKDLVVRYRPALIFADGEWEHPSSTWRSEEFLAWLFNESPCREEVVVNDRWGKETRTRHGGYYTTEYGKYAQGEVGARHKWEESRGIGSSYGYNRNESRDDYARADDIVWLLVDTVSRGGNLLLNVGPTADGRIPEIQQERLLQIGEWLAVNGEAIYATSPWREAAEGDDIRYTTRGDAVYAIVRNPPESALELRTPQPSGTLSVSMLGRQGLLSATRAEDGLRIEMPAGCPPTPGGVRIAVLKLGGVQ